MMKRIAFCTPIIFLLFSYQIYAQHISIEPGPDNDTISTNVSGTPLYYFRSATAGIVLLKNHGGLLPLDTSQINSIALIGPSLFFSGAGEGKSPEVDLTNAVSPYEGIKKYVGDAVFLYTAQGVNIKNDVAPLDTSFVYIGQGVNGFSAKYYNKLKASGSPAKFAIDKQIDFSWGYALPHAEIISSEFSVKWDASLIPPHGGQVKVKLIHNDGCRLFLDGKLMIDAWKSGPVRIDSAWLNIEKGGSYNLQIDYFSDGGPAQIKFGIDYLIDNMIANAVEKARRADVTIIFVRQPLDFEYNHNSRGLYCIPNQSRLIRAVYEANPNTIVVLQTNDSVDIEAWVFDIPAIIQAWTPRQKSGAEIAEVLFGEVNPGSKLPHRWVMSENQNFDTRFPLGYGMTYTTFGIGKLMMRRNQNDSGWIATVEIRNVGERAGSETLQVYINDPERDIEKAEKELMAFKRVTLFPGQKKTVAIPLPYEAFSYYNEEDGRWTIDPGKYEILIGTSSEEIKLRKTIEIKEEHIDQWQ
ncbi:MAG: glycoside hydrolase family 3 C-terminal domain-containing protein [Bacteroidetes bacterium]|nr:glycoside hydrolase family 3 C-terminal domain-containing protein [Bacteroidota bacterium]